MAEPDNLAARQRLLNERTTCDEEAAMVNQNDSTNQRHSSTVMSEKQHRNRNLHRRTTVIALNTRGLKHSWRRFTRVGKKKIGVMASLRAIAFSSWLNLFLIFTPFAWISHFATQTGWNGIQWPPQITFVLCFLAIVPHERIFEYGGEQMAFYLGRQLGDLLIISLNNVVEATLAIILLSRCEWLISTGVVLLHLLLIPGVAFFTGGARILEQELHPHVVQLNQTLLTIGVMALVIPAAFFAALDRGVASTITTDPTVGSIINDTMRGKFLKMSRGLAVLLHLVYISSRIFLHHPPGEGHVRPQAPEALNRAEEELLEGEPEVNQYVCIAVILLSIGVMAATAEWLVESIQFVRLAGDIQEEWFGLILLPLVSFAADGFIAIFYFLRSLIHHFFHQPAPPAALANSRAIDLSIQFILFWMPFLVLLGWWTGKPMHLLFDFFEVALLLAACFIVNYVTADAKTNWVEGYVMVSFYVMITLCSWFYTGQPEIKLMNAQCTSVQQAIANPVSSGTLV
ncbi:hypothetical protein L208DRAFT_1269941 [Tricholoma matsutake]|nr:hypothetical protein L208DRAFT_1269941 [Tricholoma matsutake 945]